MRRKQNMNGLRTIGIVGLLGMSLSLSPATVLAEDAGKAKKVDPRMEYVGKLIEQSSGAKQVAASSNPEAQELQKKAAVTEKHPTA